MNLAAFCRRSICSAEVSFNPQFGPVAYRALPRRAGSWQERIAKEILFAGVCDPPTADEFGQACGVSLDISSTLSGGPPDTRRTNG
jgi:hypothetical protein